MAAKKQVRRDAKRETQELTVGEISAFVLETLQELVFRGMPLAAANQRLRAFGCSAELSDRVCAVSFNVMFVAVLRATA